MVTVNIVCPGLEISPSMGVAPQKLPYVRASYGSSFVSVQFYKKGDYF